MCTPKHWPRWPRGRRRGWGALCASVTIDLDTTDVEVYGQHKRGVAFNHQGQRVGRPHVASWAETATVLAADLLAGNEDPRRDAPALLRRALAALPASARVGRVRLRADAGYFAGQLARAALFTGIEFAIGARRIAPLWRLLDGLAEGRRPWPFLRSFGHAVDAIKSDRTVGADHHVAHPRGKPRQRLFLTQCHGRYPHLGRDPLRERGACGSMRA